MIRNLLQVDAPLDARGERVALPAKLKARLSTAQDTLLLKFAEEDVFELLILLAQVSGDLASVVGVSHRASYSSVLRLLATLVMCHTSAQGTS